MTAQRAAALERQAVKAFILRNNEGGNINCEKLLTFLKGRTKRCNVKFGGLGVSKKGTK